MLTVVDNLNCNVIFSFFVFYFIQSISKALLHHIFVLIKPYDLENVMDAQGTQEQMK